MNTVVHAEWFTARDRQLAACGHRVDGGGTIVELTFSTGKTTTWCEPCLNEIGAELSRERSTTFSPPRWQPRARMEP